MGAVSGGSQHVMLGPWLDQRKFAHDVIPSFTTTAIHCVLEARDHAPDQWYQISRQYTHTLPVRRFSDNGCLSYARYDVCAQRSCQSALNDHEPI